MTMPPKKTEVDQRKKLQPYLDILIFNLFHQNKVSFFDKSKISPIDLDEFIQNNEVIDAAFIFAKSLRQIWKEHYPEKEELRLSKILEPNLSAVTEYSSSVSLADSGLTVSQSDLKIPIANSKVDSSKENIMQNITPTELVLPIQNHQDAQPESLARPPTFNQVCPPMKEFRQ